MRAKLIKINGGEYTLTELSTITGVPRKLIKSRLDRGVTDLDKILHKGRIHAKSKWVYMDGVAPKCRYHNLIAVFHKNKNKECGGQWACTKCNSEIAKLRRNKKRGSLDYELRKALYGAKQRGECSLTIEDLYRLWHEQEGRCAITGNQMEVSPGKNGHNRYKFSIDRIDNNKSYDPDNVWLVLEYVNRAKGDMTQKELIQFAKSVLKLVQDRVVIS